MDNFSTIETAISSDAKALDAFRNLPLSHKREYAEWLASAKKPETRQRRIGKMIDMLKGKASTHGQG